MPCPQDRAFSLRQSFVAFALAISTLSAFSYAQQPDGQSANESKTTAESSTQPSSSKQPSPRQLREADDNYLAGARLLDRGDLAGAEARFAKAALLNPQNADYVQGAVLAHEHRISSLVLEAGKARMLGHTDKAESLLAEARKLDPESSSIAQYAGTPSPSASFRTEIRPISDPRSQWQQNSQALAGPVTLLPASGKQSFEINASEQQVITQVFSRFGIRTVFDDSLPSSNIRFNLDDVAYERASSVVLDVTNTFAVPLDPHSVLIAKDTVENHQRLERQLEETIYVPGFTSEQMNELGTVVRSVFDVKQASVLATSGSLVIRAPEDTITALNLTLADLVEGAAEVVLDIRLYMVDRTRQRNIGAQLPQQIGVYNVDSAARDLVQQNQDLVNQAISQGLVPANASNIQIALALIASGLVKSSLLSNTVGFFGGGLTMSGITTNTSTNFQLSLNSSDTRALNSILLRASDGQTAIFRSGTRYPVITGSYTSGITGNASSLAGTTINGVSAQSLLNQYLGSSGSVTIPQFQYEDLGLTLEAKPTIQRSGLIRLNLKLKLEALAGSALNNIPILANRLYSSDITVAEGESTLIASSLSRSESAAVSGLPGLGELPGFQTATADKTTETDSSELVMVITPHVVQHRSNATAGPRIAFNQRQSN